jgi:hypothetical protein
MARQKSRLAEQLVARLKFKSYEVVEVTITDVLTGDVFTVAWNFRVGVPQTTIATEVKEEAANDLAPEVEQDDE